MWMTFALELMLEAGRLLFLALVRLTEAVIFVLHWLVGLGFVLVDFVRGLKSISGRNVLCPAGHLIPLTEEGVLFECEACRFRWRGHSALTCPNPECQAPTPFVYCPVCLASTRNPFRWGR